VHVVKSKFVLMHMESNKRLREDQVGDGRSRWPRGLRSGSAATRMLELQVRIPSAAWQSLGCVCVSCVLSHRSSVRLITRPEESYRVWLVWHSTFTEPQAGGTPLVGCPRLLIQYIRSYPPCWRPFLHPQPEDPPCRGDRDSNRHSSKV
jgi:hypothetical protein